jgi:hypothetical protein
VQVADGLGEGVPLTVGVGVTPVGDGDGVGVIVAVAVGVGPTIPCPESSMCCGLFFAESVNVSPFLFFTFPVAVGWNTTAT